MRLRHGSWCALASIMFLFMGAACDSDEILGTDGGSVEAGADAMADAGPDGANDAGDASDSNDAMAPLSDEQAAGILEAIDAGEVQEAQIVYPKAQTAAVQTFAAQMVTDHSVALERRRTVLATLNVVPADSDVRQMLQGTTNENVRVLQQQSGSQLERTYLSDQVAMHEAALKIITDRILPSVHNATFKTEVENARTTVEGHLGKARELLASSQLGTLQ